MYRQIDGPCFSHAGYLLAKGRCSGVRALSVHKIHRIIDGIRMNYNYNTMKVDRYCSRSSTSSSSIIIIIIIIIIYYHHHLSSSIIIIIIYHHLSSSSIIIIYYHHHLSSPSSLSSLPLTRCIVSLFSRRQSCSRSLLVQEGSRCLWQLLWGLIHNE